MWFCGGGRRGDGRRVEEGEERRGCLKARQQQRHATHTNKQHTATPPAHGPSPRASEQTKSQRQSHTRHKARVALHRSPLESARSLSRAFSALPSPRVQASRRLLPPATPPDRVPRERPGLARASDREREQGRRLSTEARAPSPPTDPSLTKTKQRWSSASSPRPTSTWRRTRARRRRSSASRRSTSPSSAPTSRRPRRSPNRRPRSCKQGSTLCWRLKRRRAWPRTSPPASSRAAPCSSAATLQGNGACSKRTRRCSPSAAGSSSKRHSTWCAWRWRSWTPPLTRRRRSH